MTSTPRHLADLSIDHTAHTRDLIVDLLADYAAAVLERVIRERDAYVRLMVLLCVFGDPEGVCQVLVPGHEPRWFTTRTEAIAYLQRCAGLEPVQALRHPNPQALRCELRSSPPSASSSSSTSSSPAPTSKACPSRSSPYRRPVTWLPRPTLRSPFSAVPRGRGWASPPHPPHLSRSHTTLTPMPTESLRIVQDALLATDGLRATPASRRSPTAARQPHARWVTFLGHAASAGLGVGARRGPLCPFPA